MKIRKIIAIIIMLLIISMSFITTVNATINPNDYKPNDLTASDYQKPFSFAKTILNAIMITGIVICVISVMYLGIKYMVGSVEERAEYKKTIIPIIVGLVMLVCTTTFVSIIYNIVSPLNSGYSTVEGNDKYDGKKK